MRLPLLPPRTVLCRSTASAMTAASHSHSCVLPSTSVTTQVTITSDTDSTPSPRPWQEKTGDSGLTATTMHGAHARFSGWL